MTSVSRPSLRLLAAMAACVVLAACGGASSGSNGSQGAKPEKPSITVGLPVPAETLAPVYLAQAKGYFQQQGLNVNLVTFQGGSQLMKAVLGGSVDIGVGALVEVLEASIQGQPVKAFYGGFDMPDFWVVASSGINSVPASKGKAWGITSFGSSNDLVARYVLKREGIPASDVSLTQTGGTAGTMAALQAGRIQATVASISGMLQEKDRGYHPILALSKLVPTYPFHTVYTKQDFLSGNPRTAKAFLDAVVKGMQLTKSDPDTAAGEIVKRHVTTQKYAKASITGISQWLYPDGRLPDESSMNQFWQMGIEGGVFQKRLPDSAWLYTKWMTTAK
jgi:NitT/TauT family transport system substrate-binding protein